MVQVKPALYIDELIDTIALQQYETIAMQMRLEELELKIDVLGEPKYIFGIDFASDTCNHDRMMQKFREYR